MKRMLVLAGIGGGLWLTTPAAMAMSAQLVASGLDQPLFVAAPSGDPRLFIVEKTGRIKVWQAGTVSTYLDLSAQVDTDGERGLLGLAFDPQFASNGRFYVDYVDKATLNTVVAGYTAPSASSMTADPASARTVITIAQPAGRNNHKAGWLGFRPGEPEHLYIATGDGGSANDPENRAQDLGDNLGKMLRITPTAGGGYAVPADNPFAGATPGNDEIWSYGLRNPYRNSFDRHTGDLWIGDVGQDLREELDFEAAGTAGGRNYGWRAREGSMDNPNVADPAPPGAVDPLFDYGHGAMGATIIGGYVYRGGADASIEGHYLFGDFVSGRIFSGRRDGSSFVDLIDRTAELGTPFGSYTLSSFGEDGFGAIYATGLDGTVYRIAGAVPEPRSALLLLAGLAALLPLRRRR